MQWWTHFFDKALGQVPFASHGNRQRRASTKAKLSASNFEELKTQFLFDIKVIIEMEEIPGDLVINWDQTGIHYVPVSSWTMAKAGSQ